MRNYKINITYHETVHPAKFRRLLRCSADIIKLFAPLGFHVFNMLFRTISLNDFQMRLWPRLLLNKYVCCLTDIIAVGRFTILDGRWGTFLAFLGWRLRMSYCDHFLSVRRPSVRSYLFLGNLSAKPYGAFCQRGLESLYKWSSTFSKMDAMPIYDKKNTSNSPSLEPRKLCDWILEYSIGDSRSTKFI